MEQVLLVIQVLLAIGLIGMVLIQRSDSDGFGLGGGSGNNLLSGRSSANLMTRTTAIFATLFIINSLALSVIAANSRAPSIVESIVEQEASKDKAPAVPVAGESKAQKTDGKKSEATVGEKIVPAVPAVGADEVPATPVKKAVKKVSVPVESDEPATDSNE
ncbi:MAG: preprotein translocase subunit SecG [Rickettsiales bacterium]|nr:preprotein translocase subunit SecG [Rickettsiales bacterium]